MSETVKSFVDILKDGLSKINQFEGGNVLFYEKFPKSRAVVSTWKYGKVKPSMADQATFVRVASEVIKELSAKQEKAKKEQQKLVNEFSTLIGA